MAPTTNFPLSFLATSPRISKYIVRRHDFIDWYPPLYQQFDTQKERIQSFKTMPIFGKQSAKSLSEAGFFYTGKHFEHKNVYYR